jgi:hypothetical protein
LDISCCVREEQESLAACDDGWERDLLPPQKQWEVRSPSYLGLTLLPRYSRRAPQCAWERIDHPPSLGRQLGAGARCGPVFVRSRGDASGTARLIVHGYETGGLRQDDQAGDPLDTRWGGRPQHSTLRTARRSLGDSKRTPGPARGPHADTPAHHLVNELRAKNDAGRIGARSGPARSVRSARAGVSPRTLWPRRWGCWSTTADSTRGPTRPTASCARPPWLCSSSTTVGAVDPWLLEVPPAGRAGQRRGGCGAGRLGSRRAAADPWHRTAHRGRALRDRGDVLPERHRGPGAWADTPRCEGCSRPSSPASVRGPGTDGLFSGTGPVARCT